MAEFVKYGILPGGRFRLSPSKMEVWERCQRSFQVTIEGKVSDGDSIYTCVGTAAHKVVERINRGESIPAEERRTEFKSLLVGLCVNRNVGLSFPPSFKLSREVIAAYEPRPGFRLLSSEQKHVLEFPWGQFSYVIDAVWQKPDLRIEIEDYKTSASVPKTQLQLQLYSMAESERDPDTISPDNTDLTYMMLRTGKRITVPSSTKAVADAKKYLEASAKMMNALHKQGGEWPTNPSPSNCMWCALIDCPVRA